LVLEILLDLNEQSAADEESLDRVTVEVFDGHILIPSTLHDAGNARRVVAVTLVNLRFQSRLGVPGVDADESFDSAIMSGLHGDEKRPSNARTKICVTVHPDRRVPTRRSVGEVAVTCTKESNVEMHAPNWLPTVVPYGADQTVYLVFDSSGASRSDCPEKRIERDDLETIISDLLTSQFSAPVRVMAFNTLEHWIEDVSNQVAEEIQTRCDIDGYQYPDTSGTLLQAAPAQFSGLTSLNS